MVKLEIRYFIDIFMLIIFIICAITGFVLWFALPSGSGGRGFSEGLSFLGVARHSWTTIHDYSSILFTLSISLHFVINFSWII